MSENDEIAEKVRTIMEAGGADVHFESSYPSWEPDPDSNILKLFRGIYKREEGREAEVKALHAGLECGVNFLLRSLGELSSLNPSTV